MLDKIKRRVLRSITTLLKIEERLDDIKILHGKMIAEMNAAKKSKNIQDYEFKVFSQWGEDGILQKLIGCIDIRNKTFIEFGVEDFYESNCRFLLMNDNWSGFVIDGSASNIDRLRNSYFYWKYPLDSRASFITGQYKRHPRVQSFGS
jgi:hypothetical protein